MLRSGLPALGGTLTTEIAVLNREAVALAADSAVTLQRRGAGTPEKIHTSANKIFTLSGSEPVGITVYGSASLGAIPWETVIKLFRRELGNTVEPKLEGYEHRLLDFIGTRGFADDDAQRAFVERQAGPLFAQVAPKVRDAVVQRLAGRSGLTAVEVEEIVREQLAAQTVDEGSVPEIHADHVAAVASFAIRYRDICKAALEASFRNVPLSDATIDVGSTLVGEHMLRRNPLEQRAGLVIAGFGALDFLPCLRHLIVDGVVDNRARAWEANPPSWNVAAQGPQIIPFAQDDMVTFFLSGVSPDYQLAVESAIGTILTQYPEELMVAASGLTDDAKRALRDARDQVSPARLGDVLAKLAAYRQTQFTQDILTVVASLPKDQLAEVAEALVSLTSLQRRMSTKAETVGGPVDVAVISKGDGLVWIRRKHYFEPALNPRYFNNTYGR